MLEKAVISNGNVCDMRFISQRGQFVALSARAK